MKYKLLLTLLVFGLNTAVFGIALNDDSLKIVFPQKDVLTADQYIRLKPGDAFPAVTLFDTNFNVITADSIFKDNKGVIFITGSYTCPYFRGSIKQINQMVKNQVNTYRVYIVYLPEAHPLKGSPYGAARDNDSHNTLYKIFIEQQRTIEERIFFTKKAMHDFKLKSFAVLDNENNDFYWKVFSGPNGMLVFSPDRKLVQQELWYNQANRNKRHEKKTKEVTDTP